MLKFVLGVVCGFALTVLAISRYDPTLLSLTKEKGHSCYVCIKAPDGEIIEGECDRMLNLGDGLFKVSIDSVSYTTHMENILIME